MNENCDCVLLCPYSAQDYTDNTENWKDTILPNLPELANFSVS